MAELYLPDLHLNEIKHKEIEQIGRHFSGTVIFVRKEELEMQETKTLLDNIIKKGLKMDLTELLVSAYDQKIGGLRLSNLRPFLYVTHVLSFGLNPEKIGLNISAKDFQLVKMTNFQCLFVPSLKDIGSQQAMKANLWNGLKSMYNI